MILIFILGFIIFIFLCVYWFIKYKIFTNNLLWNFKHCNVVVAGKKRTGKDLTFNWVINKRDDFYYANIPYGGKHKVITLQDVSIYPNTYYNFVTNSLTKIPRTFKEKKDIYISDIGNFLPSYMDSTLYKLFPSMPCFYSLSGHLYDNNVHCNTQAIERGWKALREQADFFVIVKRTIRIFNIFITKMTTYDKYSSALQGLQPLRVRLLNKQSKANYDLFVAQNGDIRKGFIVQTKKNIKYDTRYFEKLVLKGKRKH